MRSHLRRILIAAAFTFLALSGISAADLHLSFDHYYDGPAVVKAVHDLHDAYPAMTELRSLGKSEEGRDIWMLMINNPKTGKDTDKPGVYVDGTIHGNEIQATEVCLYTAYYLLTNYDSIPRIKTLLDTRAFYIIPVVNVDNRWRFFSEPGSYSLGRTARVPYDDDRDGLADEDDYDDLDGDGQILQMRVKDPFGDFKSHPDDPRVMVRVKPGEQGEYRMIDREGIDNDGDGRLNEDPSGYLDMNRNWGFKWQPSYVQEGAGDFPMSANVPKAISDFVLTKPNICFDFAFHNMGGLLVRGPGSKLAGRYPASDMRVYDFLGHEGEKILPGYEYIEGGTQMYTTHGDFDEWMFSNLGIYGFVGELYKDEHVQYRRKSDDPDEPAPKSEEPDDYERQQFNDNVAQGTMFKDWHKFKHPQLGEIEIGGWTRFTSRIAPAFMIQDMVHRNASLVIFVAENTPEVKLELLDVKDLGDGLKRVRVRASNENAMPSLSANAVKRKVYREDMFSISGGNLDVVSGGIVTDPLMDQVNFVEHRPSTIYTSVPSFGKRDIEWIVRGSGQVTVTYDAVKATNRTLTITL